MTPYLRSSSSIIRTVVILPSQEGGGALRIITQEGACHPDALVDAFLVLHACTACVLHTASDEEAQDRKLSKHSDFFSRATAPEMQAPANQKIGPSATRCSVGWEPTEMRRRLLVASGWCGIDLWAWSFFLPSLRTDKVRGQDPLKTEQTSDLEASTFTRMAQ